MSYSDCACGREYTEEEWGTLHFIGQQIDQFEELELRNCRCGRTIAVEIGQEEMMAYNAILVRMRLLVQNGWHQVSRKYHIICRLPEGKTGIEALTEAAMESRPWDAKEWANNLGESSATDQYLRVYAPWNDKKQHRQLTEQEFAAFREVGGSTAR